VRGAAHQRLDSDLLHGFLAPALAALGEAQERVAHRAARRATSHRVPQAAQGRRAVRQARARMPARTHFRLSGRELPHEFKLLYEVPSKSPLCLNQSSRIACVVLSLW
jgi:hypothetical protein